VERDDGQELAELTIRACEHCGGPVPKRRKDARFCSTSHRVMASRKRKHEREIHESLVTRGLTDQTLTGLHDRARPPQRRDADPREYSDFGEVPGDLELAAEIDAGYDDEQTARFRQLVREDSGQRKPRSSWADLKRRYAANPGVELAGITRERAGRYRAEQAAVQRRLRDSDRQPQDRHNRATQNAVASRGTESRRLNRMYSTADPRPASQREEFSFTGESFDGGPFRSGRPAGQRATHADYAWRMTDGFRF